MSSFKSCDALWSTCSMSTTPCTPPYKLATSTPSTCKQIRHTRSLSSSSSSTVPFPRATSRPTHLQRSPRLTSTHADSESPFEPRPGHSRLPSPPYPPLDFDLLTLGTLDTPTKRLAQHLTLDLDFNSSWTLDVPSSASSAMSYETALASPPPSPGEDDVFRAQTSSMAQALPHSNPVFSFTFSPLPRPDRGGPFSHSSDALPESSGPSSADADLAVLLRPRLGVGFAQGGAPSHEFAEQRYLRSAVPTPYYTAHSTPEPILANDGPKAGPSRLPILNTNITVPLLPHKPPPPAPLSATTPPLSRDPVSVRPPSPAPTADFSMISPPSSPTFYQYTSQLADNADADPFRHSHLRSTATLPFLRSNTAFPVGRTQSMSASIGLGPVMGKPRRPRPGISRLWESLASPAKCTPHPPSMPQDGHLMPIPADRAKSSPMPGFSVVRSKTAPMMGVGRKLKERRRTKQVRRGMLEADTDVDYGALDPLDGEEGELIGCTCSGWGDGACVCGYGYSDGYGYGHENTQEPECLGERGQVDQSIPAILSTLTPPVRQQLQSLQHHSPGFPPSFFSRFFPIYHFGASSQSPRLAKHGIPSHLTTVSGGAYGKQEKALLVYPITPQVTACPLATASKTPLEALDDDIALSRTRAYMVSQCPSLNTNMMVNRTSQGDGQSTLIGQI